MSYSSSEDSGEDDLFEYNTHTSDNDADDSGQSDASCRSRESGQEPQASSDAQRCKICNTDVASMAELIVHYIRQHEAPEDATLHAVTKKQARKMKHIRQKFICGMCGVECFDTLRETKRHMFEEHGYQDQNARDSGADYSSEEFNPSSDTDVSIGASGNDSIDGVSSGMLSGMSSSTQYVSSPDSRARRRSYSCLSSESEIEKLSQRKKTTHTTRTSSIPGEAHRQPTEEFEEYLRTVTLQSLIRKFKSERHHKCSRKGCQHKFETAEIREQHLLCHVDETVDEPSEPTPSTSTGKRKRYAFKCGQCERLFDSWKPCLVHLWGAHQTDLGMLQCTLCEKRFGYVVHVFNHLQTHRPKAMREIECRVCGQRFANNAQRSVHEALHRKNGKQAPLAVVKEEEVHEEPSEEPLVESQDQANAIAIEPTNETPKPAAKPRTQTNVRRCKLCTRMFANAKTLSKHVKTVHFKIKPFVCSVCGYECARKFTLNIHMRQHSGAKPLACESCSFRTADPSALFYHKLRHQPDKSHKCRVCGLTTLQPSVLKRHIQSHHPQEYERIKCRLCSFASVNAQNLRRHQAEHEAGILLARQNGNDLEGTSAERTEAKKEPLESLLPPESVGPVAHDAGGTTTEPASWVSFR